MINLFHINNYNIDTSKFSNLLHDNVVTEFEQEFAEYVGAKYACSANSASSLLYLILKGGKEHVKIPSIIPTVVPNVIVNSGNYVEYYDDIDWVGHYYKLHTIKRTRGEVLNIYDSAQEVRKNQFKLVTPLDSIMVFSFYPTKPVGSCDGGMVVSDNKELIEWFRVMTMNGSHFSHHNWERKQVSAGYKFHANSIQMHIARENLRRLDFKNQQLDELKERYNKEFGLSNTSMHLYRIRVNNNVEFIKQMKEVGIVCGIHYKACHKLKCHGVHYSDTSLPLSEQEEEQTVSIPFHEMLCEFDIKKVIENVRKFGNL